MFVVRCYFTATHFASFHTVHPFHLLCIWTSFIQVGSDAPRAANPCSLHLLLISQFRFQLIIVIICQFKFEKATQTSAAGNSFQLVEQ